MKKPRNIRRSPKTPRLARLAKKSVDITPKGSSETLSKATNWFTIIGTIVSVFFAYIALDNREEIGKLKGIMEQIIETNNSLHEENANSNKQIAQLSKQTEEMSKQSILLRASLKNSERSLAISSIRKRNEEINGLISLQGLVQEISKLSPLIFERKFLVMGLNERQNYFNKIEKLPAILGLERRVYMI